jgi:TolB protein
VELTWSPTGEQIAFSTFDAIFIGPDDGGDPRKLTDAVQPSCLSWSRDGRRIALTSGNLGYLFRLNVAPSSIWIVDVERGEAVRVTEGTHVDFSPVWTPDGKSILFVSNRGGGRDIYRIPLDPTSGISSVSLSGGEPKPLVRFDDPARPPYGDLWTTDGERFYFSLVEFEADVWVMELEDSKT